MPEYVEILREYLKTIPPGPITDTEKVLTLLENCWDELSGSDDEKMNASKLDRMEELEWAPPNLTFTIERHGGAGYGSSRAELQEWCVNIDEETASCFQGRYRQMKPRDKNMNVKPLAKEIVDRILAGDKDPRLKWYDDRRVQILIGKIIPDNGPKQTIEGRRRRFRAAVDELLLKSGWSKIRENVYAPPNYQGKGASR